MFQMFGDGVTVNMILEAVSASGASSLTLSPHFYVQMSTSKDFLAFDKSKLSHLTAILPSGSAVPAACEKLYRRHLPNLEEVLGGYGQTETGIVAITDNNSMLGSVLPGNTVCVSVL